MPTYPNRDYRWGPSPFPLFNYSTSSNIIPRPVPPVGTTRTVRKAGSQSSQCSAHGPTFSRRKPKTSEGSLTPPPPAVHRPSLDRTQDKVLHGHELLSSPTSQESKSFPSTPSRRGHTSPQSQTMHPIRSDTLPTSSPNSFSYSASPPPPTRRNTVPPSHFIPGAVNLTLMPEPKPFMVMPSPILPPAPTPVHIPFPCAHISTASSQQPFPRSTLPQPDPVSVPEQPAPWHRPPGFSVAEVAPAQAVSPPQSQHATNDRQPTPLCGIAISLWDLAGSAEVQGEYAEARLILQEAQELMDAKDSSLHAICRMSIASIDIEQGKYQEAALALHDILDSFRVADDPHDIGHCLYRLCKALLPLGKYDEVKIYAKEGCKIGKTEVLANCLRCLGYVALHNRACDESSRLFSAALDVFKGYGDRLGVADTNLALAQLMFERGEPSKAEASLNTLLLEYDAMGCPRGKGQSYLLLAKICEKDSSRSGQFTEQLKRAEAIFTRLGNSVEMNSC